MSISTKSGDQGKTGLWSGERTWKDDIRVESYGTVDELNSFLGEARHFIKIADIQKKIERIQNDLFRLAGQLASKSQQFVEPMSDKDVDQLTEWVEHFESKVKLTGFVIPGSTIGSAKLDVCRTIARRAERRIISLQKKEDIPQLLIKYINRLSDLLFIMARVEEVQEKKLEHKKWKYNQDTGA